MIPKSLAFNPNYLAPSAWWQHVPIAHWLIEELKPSRVVELGTHYGVSFFAFCEAADRLSPGTFIYAVDTWEGDDHASFYSDDVFTKVESHWRSNHRGRSTLIRSRFDDAVSYFDDKSIDILHIDGLHTYEAVKHDFETWLPKMKEESLILFHDTNVRERGFGVWQLWQELKKQYKTVEALNGHGLGILILGKGLEEKMTTFTDLLITFQAKGELLERIAQLTPGGDFGINPLEQARADAEQARADAEQARADAEQARADAEQAREGLEEACQALKCVEESRMWRSLRPIRIGLDRCKRFLKIRG
jgi:hypothetical protein